MCTLSLNLPCLSSTRPSLSGALGSRRSSLGASRVGVNLGLILGLMFGLILGLSAPGAPAFAQTDPGVRTDLLAQAPPLPQTDPVARSATPPVVESAPLGAPTLGAAGLLPRSATGLPPGLWAASDPNRLASLIAAVELPVPAMQRLMRRLILAEALPPAGDTGLVHLDSRLGWLMRQGMVEEALALLQITGVDDPLLFDDWVDLSLLLDSSEPVCARLAQQPRLSSDLSLRVFCTARAGEWERAALVLQSARSLGDVSGRQAELLVRFLDPEAGDGRPLLPPVRPTPLEFRLFEALGEPLPTQPLPLPFAVLDLSGNTGWKAQIEAAERLARAGSLDPNRLLGLYTLRRAAASGGVWDRVAALQAFERALERGRVDLVTRRLTEVWPQMVSARVLPAFAELFAEDLADLALEGRAGRMARDAVYLSRGYETLIPAVQATDAKTVFLGALARGVAPDPDAARLPYAEDIARGFSDATVPGVLAEQLQEGRLGEVILRAMALFASGAAGNGQDLTDALATMRALGLEDSARRAALELVILEDANALR